MINKVRDLVYQRVKPFATTQPIHLRWRPDAAWWLRWKPLRVLAGQQLAADNIHVRVDVNERIVELPFVYGWLIGQEPNGRRARVLDVGCAESTVCMSLATMGYQVTGVDIRPYPLTHPNFTFLQGDICQVTLPAEKYDVAICLSTLEHIGIDTAYQTVSPAATDRATLEVIERTINKDGKLLLTVPVAQSASQNSFMRIYSLLQLKTLLARWTVEKLDFFAPNRDRSSWRAVSQARLPKPPLFGVALVVASKR